MALGFTREDLKQISAHRIFGDVQAVIDANNERALLLNEDRVLSGRVVRD